MSIVVNKSEGCKKLQNMVLIEIPGSVNDLNNYMMIFLTVLVLLDHVDLELSSRTVEGILESIDERTFSEDVL